ncbi:MAG: hypothetical protein QM496_21840 [Verrucomicrobiota bacterium]
MFKFLTFVLCLFTICAAPLAHAQAGFRAGTAAVDISPTAFPMQLRSGKSNYVHDPLHVRALAFENGEGRVVIALMDAIGVAREVADEAKALAAKKTGWKPEQMLISGTHTHTAPKGDDSSPERKAYKKLRLEGLSQALIEAIESLEPAMVASAADEEPSEVFNRRWFLQPGTMVRNPLGGYDQVRTNTGLNLLKPAGPTDPEVCVVDVRTRRGRALGLIANYSLHYVGGIPKVKEEGGRLVGMASADYYGEFARIMPFRYGGVKRSEKFVAMISNGTSGDINNYDFYGKRPRRAPFEQVRIVAGKTADAAWRAVKKIESYDKNPKVAMLQREVILKYRTPTSEQLNKAIELMKLTRKERDAINKRTSSVASQTIAYASPEKERTESVIIQAVRIGDQAIVSMPFEVLVEIGLELKEKSPFAHTFTIELANGSYGYLPAPKQHKLGGYETWLGTSRFEEDSSVILVDNLLAMLGELKEL